MEEKRNIFQNKKLLLTIIGVVMLIVATVGVTYAFFNYTRTGGSNVVKTGRISFSTSESGVINLTNAFPVRSDQAANDNINTRTLSITVTGDTDYAEGLEYLVTAADVHMTTVGSKPVPLNIEIGVHPISTAVNALDLGTAETGDFYTLDDSYTTANKYKILYDESEPLTEGERLLVGYIAPNSTPGTASGVAGIITIKAYFDANRIAITDTLVGEGEGNGTTTTWLAGRTRFTTTEWNALTSSGLSFKIKVESNEGKWVEAPVVPTIASCPNCVYKYTTTKLAYGLSGDELQASEVSTNYNDVITTSGKQWFLGLILENGTSGKITRAFACGIKGTDYLNNEEQTPGVNAGTAFCVEGSTDGSTSTANSTLLNDLTTGIWQGRCTVDVGSNVNCDGSVNAVANTNGYVRVGAGGCYVSTIGKTGCY